MCNAAIIAGAAQAAGGIIQRYESGERYKDAKTAASQQARSDQASINTRIGQERVSTAYRANAMGLEADKIRGEVAASAAAGGVQGLAVQEVSAEVTSQETQNQVALAASLGFAEDQLRSEQVAVGQRAAAQAAQFMPTNSYLTSVFSGAGVGASMHVQSQARKE
ncbi:hypothetical protein DRQ25_17090 [Candidatus Fermentibacteria bacterium]|nr:MAG: hypothetical protein DRQ25_17090 [Candidatus Fermentibacteria bacterium]